MQFSKNNHPNLKNIDREWYYGRWNDDEKSCENLGLLLDGGKQYIVKSCYISKNVTPENASIRQKRFIIERDILKCIQKLRDGNAHLEGLEYITEYSGNFQENNQHYFFTPYYEGETLRESDLTVEELLRVFKQILIGVSALEKIRVNHYDIHPENVLLVGPEKHVRIIDFDLSFHTSMRYKLEYYTVGTDDKKYYYSDDFILGKDLKIFLQRLEFMLNELAEMYEDAYGIEDEEEYPMLYKFIVEFVEFADMDGKTVPAQEILERYPQFEKEIKKNFL